MSHSLLLHFVFMHCLHGFFCFCGCFFSFSWTFIAIWLSFVCIFHLVFVSLIWICFHLYFCSCTKFPVNEKLSFTITILSNKQHSTSSIIAVQHNIFLVQIRYRKDRMQSKLKPYFPVVNEVKDLSNGCAIAAVIHHYCPGLLRLEGMVTFQI